MIRVLHVIGSMGMGGAEMLLMNLYRNIDRDKIQFDFAVHTEEEGIYDDEIKKLGGRIFHFKRFNGLNFQEYRRQWKVFFNEHPEHKIVHGHIGSCAALYLSVANRYGKETIAHSHSTRKKYDFSFHNILWSVYSFPTRYIAKHFMACSYDAGRDRFGKRVASSKEFMVLNNGIDSKKFIYSEQSRNLIREEFKIDNIKTVIGHIGRFDPEKNQKFLVEVFNEYSKLNPKALLILVGDGKLKKEVFSQIKKMGLTDKVILTGIRKDTHCLLSAFDYFVFPSVNEGLGISLIEAQAAGLMSFCSEAIPKDAYITPLLNKLYLKEGPGKWAERINNVAKYKRKDYSNAIKASHYDISYSANQLQMIYNLLLQQEFVTFCENSNRK